MLEHPLCGRLGSSPHTRGARPSSAPPPTKSKIIPAYAGSTEGRVRFPGGVGDHPRIRGEHVSMVRRCRYFGGSSPHTRGARRPVGPRPRACRIIPAYAGSTAPCTSTRPSRADHPRIRGEHRLAGPPHQTTPGSSPHTRGARSWRWHPGPCRRIIPAYAGSTPGRPGRRPRGGGSSPHTRGAPG